MEIGTVIEGLKSVQKVVDQKTVIDIETMIGPVRDRRAGWAQSEAVQTCCSICSSAAPVPARGEIRLAGIDPFARRGRPIR